MPPFTRDARRARPAWLDARFLIGLVLVVASVAGVWGVVNAARQTAPALAVERPVVPGQSITAADVVQIDVQLGAAADGYLSPADLDDGLVATAAIAAGDLIPAAAVAEADATDVTAVVVRSTLDVPANIDVGSTVELWASPAEEPGEHGEPRVIVTRATVANLVTDDGVMRQEGAVVELVVSRDVVGEVLRHVSGGSALSVVPASLAREPDAADPPDAENGEIDNEHAGDDTGTDEVDESVDDASKDDE